VLATNATSHSSNSMAIKPKGQRQATKKAAAQPRAPPVNQFTRRKAAMDSTKQLLRRMDHVTLPVRDDDSEFYLATRTAS